MSTIDATDQAAPESSAHHALPDPGESVPKLALPTVAIFLGALTAFVLSTIGYITGRAPFWVTIPVNAAVTLMFTVVHDASHYSISSKRWANGLFGRLAWLFVGPVVAFPSFGYIHIQHHRHSNDDDEDPDTFASHGPLWLLPLRWSTVEYFYLRYYLPRARSRPVAEVAETLMMLTLSLTGLIVAIVTGNFWTLAVVFLIPQRIGLTILAWWFDSDRPVRDPIASAEPETLRGPGGRQRDHTGAVNPGDDAGDRDRKPVHADLWQPHQGVDDV
jgi:fatty acid desaturase